MTRPIPLIVFFILAAFLALAPIPAFHKLAAQNLPDSPEHRVYADSVLVKKSESRLFLMKDGQVLKSYHVVFGANPRGHKEQEGDQRTPEGRYSLNYKKADSAYYKAIRISYPNRDDRAKARQRGIHPGGQIMIHGQKNGRSWLAPFSRFFNWTDGCIAVTDAEMEEIWQAVQVGTPIEILP